MVYDSLNLTSYGDVDSVAAVSVFRFTPVHPAVGQFDRFHVAVRGNLVSPAQCTLGQLQAGNTAVHLSFTNVEIIQFLLTARVKFDPFPKLLYQKFGFLFNQITQKLSTIAST